jgi:hypothetical protein
MGAAGAWLGGCKGWRRVDKGGRPSVAVQAVRRGHYTLIRVLLSCDCHFRVPIYGDTTN